MRGSPYNVRKEEENADREMKEKCLDANGESDVEKKPTNSVDGDKKKLGTFNNSVKQISAKRTCWIIAFLCFVLVVFLIIIIGLAARVGWLEMRTNLVQCNTAECLGASSKIVSGWNTSFDPCHDFWKFSCGEWLNKQPLPNNKGSFGVVDERKAKVYNNLRHILDLVPHDATVRDPEWKAKQFYHTCMNVEAVEQTTNAFKNIINEIGGWTILHNWSSQRWDKSTIIERLHVDFGVTPFFKLKTESIDDSAEPHNIIKILPSGLGLQNPRYYFLTSENKYETVYKKYMEDIAREFGGPPLESSRFATSTFGFEKRLAEVSPSVESYRDPFKHYKKLTVHELGSLAPTVSWMELLQKYFPSANINQMTEIMIFNETYFRHMSNILSTTDNVAMHNYLMWQFTFAYAPHLSNSTRVIANRFYQSLEGVPNPKKKSTERWEYCLQVTSEYLGHALGSMYVKHYLVPESVKEADDVKGRIQRVFSNYVNSIPWAKDYHTRSLIKEKMEALSKLTGYPDFIRNSDALSDYYNELNVQIDFLENIKSGKYFLRKKMEAHLKPKVALDDGWTIFPQAVQSVYHYHKNQIVIPAGLLQEPFYEPSAPLSIRFGSLGTHIASQMFKGLDDKGISYQKMGGLHPWLSGQSAIDFQHKLECLIKKINHNAEDGLVNGNLTVGELIADIAAVKFSYQAYRDMETEYDLPGIGRTHDQVFFIAYAQSMCEHIRPEKVRMRADLSTTSPHEKRIVNTLRELPEFAQAFSCPTGTPMYSTGACHMW